MTQLSSSRRSPGLPLIDDGPGLFFAQLKVFGKMGYDLALGHGFSGHFLLLFRWNGELLARVYGDRAGDSRGKLE